MSVTPLHHQNQLCNTAEDKALYLEQLAKRIREGKLEANRCIFVADNKQGGMIVEPFGPPCDRATMVGLLFAATIKETI